MGIINSVKLASVSSECFVYGIVLYIQRTIQRHACLLSAVKISSNKEINTVKETHAITELKRLPIPLIGIL